MDHMRIWVLKSDSSGFRWGGTRDKPASYANGMWSMKERDNHINFLELKAGFLTLQDLCGMDRNCHIRLYKDNTVAVTCITKMGGKISHLNELTRQIWLWCIDRNIIWRDPKILRPIFSQERVTKTLKGPFIMKSFKKSKIILVFVILIYLHL